MIINDWQDQGDTSNDSTIQLDFGMHDLTMEYYDQGGGETAYLYWTKPNQSETFVQAAYNGYCDCECNNTFDCSGECGGLAQVDECGVCDDNQNNNCIQDCNGNWGGSS